MSPSPTTLVDETPLDLLRLCPRYAPTPLIALPRLAAAIGLGAILAKDEGRRPLGSFKALGGVYAGLRALARASGRSIKQLLEPTEDARALPALICASDGNHGLAVAAAARLAGAKARVFLPDIVPPARVARILAKGAEVVRVDGTYDEAVRAAARVARQEEGVLVADTSNDPNDPVVADVMAAYGVIAEETRSEIAERGHLPPTHIFVQAGVGGLAAAMARGLEGALAPPAQVAVVEPAAVACVAAALGARRVVTLPGKLQTSAEMLSCGEASAPALVVLMNCNVAAIAVSEADLLAAPQLLESHGGPATTPSGAAGLAGLIAARRDRDLTVRLGLGSQSRALLIVTESPPN
ncbi:MAG TPA: pyridoxal-phosphate dependent enzyme [Roseiarcus sp.]|nr:pyridoxal-phosphate dependent enzyme [Roseiarcus sp.]